MRRQGDFKTGSMKEYYHDTPALTSASIAGSKSEMVSFPPSSDPAYTR